MPDRARLAVAFLESAGWADARREALAGDASARRYERLVRADARAVLMDAPPGQGEEIEPFVRVARHLRELGLSAPRILHEDAALGFLLLEDIGDDLFARLIPRRPDMEHLLYAEAVEVLAVLQANPALPDLPDASAQDWAEAAAFALDWYAEGITDERPDSAAFVTALTDTLAAHADGKRVMILRDYHAENLLWLPDRTGVARVGVLDFQLAQMGQPGYDLVSLCQDARRNVPDDVEAAAIRRFVARTGADEDGFVRAYAVLGAQRALRIIGVFARLAMKLGKPGYLPMLPRVWDHLQRNLAHPALSDVARICAKQLPSPTPANLERIAARCPAR
jgi:aminoglycoside/choline kinase family phosphotransferase